MVTLLRYPTFSGMFLCRLAVTCMPVCCYTVLHLDICQYFLQGHYLHLLLHSHNMPVSLLAACMWQVAAGRDHSAALTGEGHVWVWGAGESGQLGLGQSPRQQQQPDNSSSSSRAVQQQAAAQDMSQDSDQVKETASDQDIISAEVSDIAAAPSAQNGPQWQLLTAVLSPVRMDMQLPSSCHILFLALGGDHSMAVVDMEGASCSSHEAAREPLLPDIPEAGNEPMDVDLTSPRRSLKPKVQTAGPKVASKYGANMLPKPLPPLKQLATAAAHSATAKGSSPALEQDPAAVVAELTDAIEDVFSSPGLLLATFAPVTDQPSQRAMPSAGLDITAITSTYAAMLKSYAPEVVAALGSTVGRLLQELLQHLDTAMQQLGDAGLVELLVILLQVNGVCLMLA